MSLIDYWPDSDAVNACIKPEAEGASPQVLLAVHQPAPLVYRLARGEELVPTNEAELFDYVISKNVPSGAHVVPITGDSGVGKSHLVRLIAARLKALPNHERYVSVRIPKSASLRMVVEEILQLLPSESYGAVRKAFKEALTDVDPGNAAIRFQSALDISLRDLSRELRTRLQQNPADQDLKQQLDHAQRLPLLLSDALTRDHFREGVLNRIVQSAVSGRRDTQNDTVPQFSAQDLDIPPHIELTKASEPVQRYYHTALQAREGHGKKVAAQVLNGVLDSAIRQLFHLNESLGGMTLQEVILAIRTQMLKDGHELVILVEDFRALTGIQETLLNVLIQEGVRDGRQIYATMRSVIAVTEGYLTGKETIATRATREWIIPKRLNSNAEVLDHTQRLVAAYLNAARWGEEALVSGKVQARRAEKPGEMGVPIFGAEEDDATIRDLKAFGSVSDVPLFPLTRSAIDYFSSFAQKEGDDLVFNPRATIGFLRDVLLFGRQPYLERRFPPATIKPRHEPTADVANWLSTQRLSPEDRERYDRVIVIWGNAPQDRTHVAHIPPEVFTSFSLPIPAGITAARTPAIPELPKIPSASQVQPTVVDDAKTVELGGYRAELENWIQKDGPPLNQTVANLIRTGLSAALSDRIDWNRERCLKMTIGSNQISIPHSKGSGREAANAFPLTTDRYDTDGQLRVELTSLLRFYHVWKKDMNYAEVDDDLARIANLADRLLPDALSFVRADAAKRTTATCALLASNSRTLGVIDGGRTPGALKTFLFEEAPPITALPESSPEPFINWVSVQQKAAQVRPRLIEAVLENCGCFQGIGKTVNGMDIIRVVQAFSDDAEGTPADISSLTPDVKATLSELGEPRVRVRASQAVKEASRIRQHLEAALGSSFDKNATTDAMLELAEELRGLAVWSESDLGLTCSAFKTLCEEFRSCPLKDALEQLSRINLTDEGTTAAILISQLARVKLGALVVADRFVTTAERVIKYADRHAKTTEDQYKGVSPADRAHDLVKEFDQIMSDLTQLQPTETKHAAAKRA